MEEENWKKMFYYAITLIILIMFDEVTILLFTETISQVTLGTNDITELNIGK